MTDWFQLLYMGVVLYAPSLALNQGNGVFFSVHVQYSLTVCSAAVHLNRSPLSFLSSVGDGNIE